MAQYRKYHMDVERVMPLESVTIVARNMKEAKELVLDMIDEGDIQILDVPEAKVTRIRRGRLVKAPEDSLPYRVEE